MIIENDMASARGFFSPVQSVSLPADLLEDLEKEVHFLEEEGN